MKKMTILIMLGVLFVAACTQVTKDNGTQIANPASKYCTDQGGKLEIITAADKSQSGVCTLTDGTKCDEWAFFRGECPVKCGECPMLSPPGPDFCKDGKIIPGEKNECGCNTAPKCEPNTDEGVKFYCTPEQKKAQACTLEYAPVCGWFNQDIKCIKYPCASTYGNKCQACAAENVDFYTEGECPG